MKPCKKRTILIIMTSGFAGFDIKMLSSIARRDISRAGIILLVGLQLRALLERGFYSREGLTLRCQLNE